MPESKGNPPLGDAFAEWEIKPSLATMSAALKATTTITELFKLANDEHFKTEVARLKPDEVKGLRAVYKEMQTALDGKVKLETFEGQVVNIVGITWWHSDAYDNDGVSLEIRTEREPDKKQKALTSSAPIVTFCNRLRMPPSESEPVRVMFTKVPVRDPERAARGHTIWQVKQMPPARDHSGDSGVPF